MREKKKKGFPTGIESLNLTMFLKDLHGRVTKLEEQVKKLNASMDRVVENLGGGAD